MSLFRFRALLPLVLVLGLSGCEYVELLRPSVLKQLNPRVIRLVNYLPEVDEPNEAMVGRLLAHGGLEHAEVGRDCAMRATVRAPEGEFIWEPAIVVMPRGGSWSSISPTPTSSSARGSCRARTAVRSCSSRRTSVGGRG